VPLVLDDTPLAATNNSYASVVTADDYVATRVVAASTVSAWEALDEEVKVAYLVNASRALDSFCEWIGDRYSRDQGLKWPRINAFVDGYLVDQITFPRPVVEATVEMALWYMLNSSATVVSTNTEFDSIKVGPITVDFNDQSGTPVSEYFPDQIAILLKDYGGVVQPNVPSGNMLKQVRLVRA
jgi:hypothetical protein